MEYFETEVKTSFDGNRGFLVPVHGVEPQRGVNKGRLEVTASDLRGIFEPVIREVLKLIDDQIQQTAKQVKLILLVGGFGGSPYLRKCIRNKFPTIEIKMAQNSYVSALNTIFRRLGQSADLRLSETAVVRGALLKGLAEIRGGISTLPYVRSRKARKYYGTECLTVYKEGVHSPLKK